MELAKLQAVLRKVKKADVPRYWVKEKVSEAFLKTIQNSIGKEFADAAWPNYSGYAMSKYIESKEGREALKINQRHPAFI